jgi:hypothetical protein
MHPHELQKLLQHILVWLPHGSQIKNEVQDIINKIKIQHPQ